MSVCSLNGRTSHTFSCFGRAKSAVFLFLQLDAQYKRVLKDEQQNRLLDEKEYSLRAKLERSSKIEH
jgi:hypothetical protein